MKDRSTFRAGSDRERGGGVREHGSSAKKIVTAATALGPWGGPVSEARPVDAADASASQGATAVFAREASRRVGCCASPGGVRRRRNRTVERGSCGCRRRAASSRGDDHDRRTASGPVQSSGADDQTEACGSFRHPGREVGADHALCTPRRSSSGPGRLAAARAKHQTKAVQKKRTHAARSRTVSPPFKVNLAPLHAIVAGAQRPLVPVSNGHDRYLWLAGSSFAVLALAGLSLLMLTMRIARPVG